MVLELLAEIQHEIVSDPTKFAIELVQFALLLAIVWVVAVGFGKRRGFVKNMLVERRQNVASELEMANGAEDALVSAQQDAAAAVTQARAEAKRTMAEARKQAKAQRASAAKGADREAEALRDHGRQLVEMERQEMLADARERLLEVVGSATRHILSERLSPAEQRALVQHAIMSGLEGEQPAPVPKDASLRHRAEAKTA